jgi:hypothetical protein
MTRFAAPALLAAALSSTAPLRAIAAQAPGEQRADTVATHPPAAAQPPAPQADTTAAARAGQGTQATHPPIDFSGAMFGNYQVRTDSAARAQTGGKYPDQFVLDRVYLTFRMPVGDRASIRATTDIFQNAANGYYSGWTLRLKYGYLQYDVLRDIGGQKGFNVLARLGMLHTVVIDHEEQFWPRYLGPTGVDRFGFFQSADLGAAAQVSLPNRWGEIYGTVTNGSGYQAPEADRFKDFALRASFTPFASHAGLLQTLAISPWVYEGFTASRFAAGGEGQVGPVTEPLKRDRWGLFAGIRDPRLTLGAHYAHRAEGFETGANTPTSPRRVTADSSGSLWSAYTVVRPWRWQAGKNTARLGALVRWDRFTPRTATAGHEDLIVAGVQLEPTTRTALTVDYQSLAPVDFLGRAPITTSHTWFLHWSATF